ncbi:STY4528 family pathogenicity island replication protein [Citrobacter amalonaticus]|uniref:STY4528 family pathogenicity island replication protein n=1 Tax=Citrobacter amalonaticus TaxID=35703 RepID=UPI0035B64676
MPHSDKASRETVSRALLVLRLTGWVSLCKRIRDKSRRIRSNIYAQHNEPLGQFDAQYFDPGWLDAVSDACRHINKKIRLTAQAVFQEIKSDTRMRHQHSRVVLIEARLSAPQTPQEMVLSR